jgi:Domain of unknown function (DUF4124)
MDSRLTPSRLLAIMLTSALALPVSAGGLYKAVGADGTILVSDTPPPSDARIVQAPTSGTTGVATAPGMPSYELIESDGPVARANIQVDLAEHSLALARQGLWSPHDGLHLATARMTPGDKQRVAFYKKGVLAARQQLMDLLRKAPVQIASR